MSPARGGEERIRVYLCTALAQIVKRYGDSSVEYVVRRPLWPLLTIAPPLHPPTIVLFLGWITASHRRIFVGLASQLPLRPPLHPTTTPTPSSDSPEVNRFVMQPGILHLHILHMKIHNPIAFQLFSVFLLFCMTGCTNERTATVATSAPVFMNLDSAIKFNEYITAAAMYEEQGHQDYSQRANMLANNIIEYSANHELSEGTTLTIDECIPGNRQGEWPTGSYSKIDAVCSVVVSSGPHKGYIGYISELVTY